MSARAPRRGRSVDSSQQSSDILRSKIRLFGVSLVCAKLALVPVVFDHDSDVPFSVIKALLSHALAYLLAGVMLALIVRYGRVALVWSWLHVPVLAFLGVNAAATLFAVDPLLALYGAHTRMGGLGTIADGVLLYVAIALLVRSRRDVLALGASFLVGSMVVLGYELVQYLGLDPFAWTSDAATRPFSTIGQATNLAEYLTVVAVGTAAVAAFSAACPALARVFLALYSGLAIGGTIATQTRSALLGMVVGIAVLFALVWVAHPARRARALSVTGAALAGAVLSVVVFATPLGARLLSTVEVPIASDDDSGLQFEPSADVRVALYRIALEMVRDRPVLGHGPDNFLASLPQYRSTAEPFGVQDNATSSAHGWPAQVAATSGVVGAAAFVSIAAAAVALTVKGGFRPEAWASVAMLGAFLGAGLTTVNAIATDWLFWASAGVIASTTSQPAFASSASSEVAPATSGRHKTTLGRQRTMTTSVVAYGCLGVALILGLTTVSAIDASRSARASQLARLQGRSQVAIESGLRATRSDPMRPQYWDALGLAYVSANRLSEAAAAFDRASKLAPYDVRYDGDLARALAAPALHGDTTSVARARDVADRAVRTDPNNPVAHQTRAVVMQIAGSLGEALMSSERARALDRTSAGGVTIHPEIYVTGVQVLAGLGRHQEAIALARSAVAKAADQNALAQFRFELSKALAANGQLSEALTEVEAVLASQPGNVAAQQLRAQIFAALGR